MIPAMPRLAERVQLDAWIAGLAGAVRHWMDASPGDRFALVGVRRRGDLIAKRMAEHLPTDRLVGVGAIDITLYRDDLSEIGPDAAVGVTELPMDLSGVQVVLVDDVLMTGRTVRAALHVLQDHGRAKRVRLAVLVNRRERQLPIEADVFAHDVGELPTGATVKVLLTPVDAFDAVEMESGLENGLETKDA